MRLSSTVRSTGNTMDRYDSSERACLLITAIDALGTKKRHSLLRLFESAGDIFEKYKEKQDEIIGLCGREYYDKLDDCIKRRVDEALLSICEKKDIVPVTLFSDNYPVLLSNIFDPPLVLFCKGDISLLEKELAIGVVGSRRCSRYGLEVAEKFGEELSDSGVTVVSGLARGIDGSAHRGALKAGARTIAVLGCGVDVVYPPEHKSLYEEIVEKGLVISEYLPSSPPLAYRFPERNRIISGISNGLLVVEAGDRSGALITLDDAIEQGKEIFIIPSNINSRTAKGSNERLRAMPSALTIEVADVLDRFGKRAKEKKEADCIQLDFTEEKIIALLETDERHFDELLDETGLSPSELSSLLSRMEVLGLVKDLGGNYYGL